jgi:hypothetical protein
LRRAERPVGPLDPAHAPSPAKFPRPGLPIISLLYRTITVCANPARVAFKTPAGRKLNKEIFSHTPLGYIFDVNSSEINKTSSKSSYNFVHCGSQIGLFSP